MASLGQSGKVTLVDVAKTLDPQGNTLDVAELLNQSNEVLLDMPFYEANSVTGHLSGIRTGLPTAIWRQMYQGVPASKSVRENVTDSLGMLEARSEVDVEIAKLSNNLASFRLSEADSFIEAMNQTMAQALFYGNTAVNPEQFMGLAPRFSAISGAANAQNVLSQAGAGADNTSVWLVGWGQNTVFGIYPKGSKAGLEHQDLGEIDAFDASNNRFRAYADLWKWKCGLVVKDWRYVVRICNIDVSDLIGSTGSQNAQQLIKGMIASMANIPAMGRCTPVFYANRTVKKMLSIQALDKSQNVLALQPGVQQLGTVAPGSVAQGNVSLLGVPVRTVDRILNSEAVVA